jgi:hypothetical protein
MQDRGACSLRGDSGAGSAFLGSGAGQQAPGVPKLAALQSTADCLERENRRLREGLSRPASAATNGAAAASCLPAACKHQIIAYIADAWPPAAHSCIDCWLKRVIRCNLACRGR